MNPTRSLDPRRFFAPVLACAALSPACSNLHIPTGYAEVEIHVAGFDTNPGPVCVYLPRLPGSELDYDAQVADVIHAHAVATPEGVAVTFSGFDETSETELDLSYAALAEPYASTLAVSSSSGAEYSVELDSPCDDALDPSQSSPLDAGSSR